MTGFINKAACHGHRPSPYGSVRFYHRPRLISRLLREREVARFVVAPPCYGKTTLAIEYAEMVFGFAHVFWINGASPCFVRDLDAGTIAKDCFVRDPKAALVVVDDLPLLDDKRTEALSEQIDALLENGCEVLVNCTPARDGLGRIQPDSVRLCPSDLLLDDSELDFARSNDEREQKPVSKLGPSHRVPGLAWPGSAENAQASFAKASFAEELPNDVRLALGSLLVLRAGAIESLDAIAPGIAELVEQLAQDYPHCGIDVQEGCFEAPQIDMDDLVPVFGSRLADITRWVEGLDGATLAKRWADTLASAGGAARACDVVRCFCMRNDRALWLYGHAYDLMRAGSFFETVKAIRSIGGRRFPEREGIAVLEVVCLALLNDVQGALKICRRYALGNTGGRVQAAALVLLARLSSPDFRPRALELLASFDLDSLDEQNALDAFWMKLARGCGMLADGVDRLAVFVADQLDAAGGFLDDALALLASWMFQLLSAQAGSDRSWWASSMPEYTALIERALRARLSEEGLANFHVASAALSMEQAHMKGMPLADGPLDVRSSLILRSIELRLVIQRRAYEKFSADEERAYNVHVATHPGTMADLKRATTTRVDDLAYPQVMVRMFGRFDVAIGGRRIDMTQFRRYKVKTLLAMLVIQGGHELTRERLVSSLWPDSEPSSANKNYYALLSQLRRALRLQDGTCPYILSHRLGVSIDEKLVKSDYSRMNEICRTFLFDEPDPVGWADLYREIDRDFAVDLLPSEHDNDFIVEARVQARTRLVDALVAATGRIVEAEYPEWGIWFARSAIAHDNTREDAYGALMKAQAASGQRTAALATFLDCRRVLDRELGVEPSAELAELYQQMLCEDKEASHGRKRGKKAGRGAASLTVR